MDKQIFKDITYGIYFVTTKDQTKNKVGCIINTLTQITSTNPMISISLNKENYTNQAIQKNQKFAISIISEKTSKTAITTFGYHSSKEIDKFQKISYEEQEEIPIIKENTCGYIIAECINKIDCGTHNLILAKVLQTKKINNNTPMTYQYYHKNLKGTSPKKAPTYIEEENSISTSKKYRCTLCGYIYDDAKEPIKFEDLPEDWKCPLCGATKDQFQKI